MPGLSVANLANKWLNILNGTAFTAPTAIYVQLHVGDPGAAGTANPSAVTTRAQVTFQTAANGSLTITGTDPSWSMTATETLTAISHWDALTGGDFLWSANLSTSQAVNSGDTFTLTSDGLSLSPTAG